MSGSWYRLMFRSFTSVQKRILITFTMVILVMLGTFLRFWSLDRAIVWSDESMTLMWVAGHRYSTAYRLVVNQLVTPQQLRERIQIPPPGGTVNNILFALKDCALYRPVLYIMLFYWGNLAGFDIGHMRMLPAILGMFAVLAAYWFGLELFRSRSAALLASAFFLVSPLAVHFSREIRESSLIILLALLSSASFLLAMRTGRIRHWLLYSIIMICGFYSSFSVSFVFVSNIMYAILSEKPWLHRITKPLLCSLLATLFAVLVSLPNILDLLSNFKEATHWVAWTDGALDWSVLLPGWIRNVAWPFLYPSELTNLFALDGYRPIWNVINPCLFIIYCLFSIALLVSVLTAFRFDRDRTFRYLGLVCLVPFVVIYVPDLFGSGCKSLLARYNLLSSLAILYFIAYGCWRYGKSSTSWKRNASQLTAIFVILCSLCGSFFDISERERTLVGPQQLPIYRVLNLAPKAIVVSMVESENLPCLRGLSHTLNGNIRFLYLSHVKKLEHILPPDTTEFFIVNPPAYVVRYATENLHFKAQAVGPNLVKMQK